MSALMRRGSPGLPGFRGGRGGRGEAGRGGGGGGRRADEHMSEYVGTYAQRLAWLTGFEGSAGSAVVLPQEAAIFVDGRYTLQVRQQVNSDHWSYQSVPETSISE